MKKLFILALAVFPMLLACNKKDNGGEMETPVYAEAAAKVTLNGNMVLPVDGVNSTLQEICFMRSGRYVALLEERVKSESPSIVISGTYTFSAGEYKTSGALSITVKLENGKTVINDVEIDADVEYSDIVPGSTEDKVSRSWKVSHFILNFPKLGAKARYENLAEIVADIEKHEIEISADIKSAILQHEVKEISVDNGIVVVTFNQAKPFMGQFELGNGTTFTYSFKSDSEINFFSLDAAGSVVFSADKAVITVEVKTNHIEQLGSGSAEITLIPA